MHGKVSDGTGMGRWCTRVFLGLALWIAPLSGQSISLVIDIGTVDGPPAEAFERIVGVHSFEDGSIAILDQGDGSIRVFDAAGRFQHRFGGRGEGPAEFVTIGGSLLQGDTLIVLDRANGKLAYFTQDREDATWDVISPHSGRVVQMRLPAKLEVHTILAEHILGVMEGEWDEDRVEVYRVRWE